MTEQEKFSQWLEETYNESIEEESEMHPCQRCKRPVKVQYLYCYRCKCYLEVKARIAMEQAS